MSEVNKNSNFETLISKNIKKDLIIYYLILLIVFWIINTIFIKLGHFTYKFTSKNNNLLIDSLYYTIVSQTGTGYGDIVPTTSTAKFITIIHLLTTYILIACIIF